jgi:hypothetical protein
MAVVHKYNEPNLVICLQNLEVLNLKTPFHIAGNYGKKFQKKGKFCDRMHFFENIFSQND